METRLQEQLDRRKREGNLRSLMPAPNDRHTLTSYEETTPAIDFSSNDYLGLACSHNQHKLVQKAYDEHLLEIQSREQSPTMLGATGSRLLSGDSLLARSLEKQLACIHNRPASLLFNSGYDANLSVLSSLPYREGDAIVMDELVHNSLVMGVRMGRLKSDRVFLFRHNDTADLRRIIQKLQQCNKVSSILVVVESVYSMDGDIAPLHEMLDICLETEARLMVDEAHGLGIYGKTNVQDLCLKSENATKIDTAGESFGMQQSSGQIGGTGVLAALNLEHHPSLFCSVYTFGKAAGCHGAVVAGSETLISYLVNYARPFVYSTALPPHSLISIQQSYKSMTGHVGDVQRRILFKWIHLFRKVVSRGLSEFSPFGIKLLPSPSPVQALIVPGSENCITVCKYMCAEGLKVYPIRSPTVSNGAERIRIILHAQNSENDIQVLAKTVLIALDICYRRSKL